MRQRPVLRRAACALVLLGVTLAAVCGCAGKSHKDEDLNPGFADMPVEQIYDLAFKLLQQKRYTEAGKAFDEVERQHPYSIWARRSMLMAAFSYYEANKYDDAINAADSFLSLHPGNRDAPYAYYLKAICYYEQISDVGRDQENTLRALTALDDIVRRYPDTEYARDAKLKIDLTRDHLAGKEMYIGRYYLQHGQYIGAIGRFKDVIETYQTTSHVPEALERMTEAYFALGLDDEAQASAAVLGYNFPDSIWYRYAYDLLRKRGVESKTPPPGHGPAPEAIASAAPPAQPVTATPSPPPPQPQPAVPPISSSPSAPPAPAQAATSAPSPPVEAASAAPAPAANPAPAPAAATPPASPAPAAATSAAAAPAGPAQAPAQPTPAEASAPPATPPQVYQSKLQPGSYTENDLENSWVRRLWRNLF